MHDGTPGSRDADRPGLPDESRPETSSRPDPAGLILLTGATGYVGGRLLRKLEESGHQVRCMARKPEHLMGRTGTATQVVAGDVTAPETLDDALSGVHTAYYLIHSMGSGEDFSTLDREAAVNFAQAAGRRGVKRIVYLGGLGRSGAGQDTLSEHLRSRQEVGAVLGSTGVEVIEFRASIIIGSGSLSFDMIRALVERLPVMITPRWVSMTAQPIAIDDVLGYLVAAIGLPSRGSRIVEIGGRDKVSYGGIMEEFARQRGLRRIMIGVPFLTPNLSSLWLGLVTPVYARVGRALIDGIQNSTVVRDRTAEELFDLRPVGISEAIRRAIRNEDRKFAETRWSSALSSAGKHDRPSTQRFGTRIVDSRVVKVSSTPEQAFAAAERIGGATGYYYADWLWRLRGFMDLLAGGAGTRRGRRDPDRLREGEVVDFWRVESIERGRHLRLAAEMKLPGRAWLEFEVLPSAGGGAEIRQTAIFDPLGLAGLVYWYALYPLHELVFRGMLRGLARAASRPAGTPPVDSSPAAVG